MLLLLIQHMYRSSWDTLEIYEYILHFLSFFFLWKLKYVYLASTQKSAG